MYRYLIRKPSSHHLVAVFVAQNSLDHFGQALSVDLSLNQALASFSIHLLADDIRVDRMAGN